MKLNPNNTWRLVEERMKREQDPKTRRNLELVLQHMKQEAQGDIEGVVATLCEEPKYVAHDIPDEEAMNPQGNKDAVRAFYDMTIVQTGAHQLEFDCDRVIADHEAVMTEGVMRMAYPGQTLISMGVDVVRTHNRDLIIYANMNQFSNALGGRPNLSILNGQVNTAIRDIDRPYNGAKSDYTALQFSGKKRMGETPIGRLSGTFAYTWANQEGNSFAGVNFSEKYLLRTESGYNFDTGEAIGESPDL